MAEPAKVIEFKLPKRRPRVVEKVAPPDQRKFAVVPMRAATDVELHGFSVKVLVLLCSYANRAGLTWVGQQRIADHLQAPKQQVARAMKQLRERGHVEVVSKGFRGEKANTVRIIYDPEVKTEDAISLASSKEDSRPPEQIKREVKAMAEEFTEEQMAANRARLREMLGGLSGRNGFHNNKPERMGDIMARKPRAKKAPIDNTRVVHEKPIIDNIIDNTGVVQTQKNIDLGGVIGLYEKISKELKTYVTTTETDVRFAELLCQVGCSVDRFEAACRALNEPTRLADVCDGLIG
jgi:biotin operon repressor